MRLRATMSLVVAILLAAPLALSADEVDDALKAISQVGPQGAGSVEARKARDVLARHGVEILPRLLAALDTPNIVAANWLRTVYADVVSRELAKPQSQLPLPLLKEYVLARERQGRARRLVLQLIEKLEPGFTREFLTGSLGDREFRGEAITQALAAGDAAAQAGNKDEAKRLYQAAFENARDASQVQTAAAKLAAQGVQASIVDQMGFVVDWWLLGPFDAPEYSGFDKVFPPEKKVDLAAKYDGQMGTIAWKRFHNPDALGQLNLIDAVASTKEAVAYAYTELESPKDVDAQLRCGADDNCSVWLNGEKVFGRNQWLNGSRLDRFIAPVHLRKGKNTVLVKICQGPQHKDPEVPNNWSLQLRFCDAEGAGVGLRSQLPAP